MPKFNVLFQGDLLPGLDPEAAKASFARLMGIVDHERIEDFFSGDEVVLRRNLRRVEAEQLAHRLQQIGLLATIEERRSRPVTAGPELSAEDTLHPTPAITQGTLDPLAGKPNLFSLRPFRNDKRTQDRANRAANVARYGLGLGILALGALIMLTVRWATLPGPTALPLPTTLATDAAERLLVIAGEGLYLHDRSGTPTLSLDVGSLGLAAPSNALLLPDGGVVLKARATEGDTPALFRCDLAAPACTIFFQAETLHGHITLATADQGAALVLANTRDELLKLSLEGERLAGATLPTGERPMMINRAGLLYLDDPTAPALRVIKPDTDGFGTQLDQLLLLTADGSSAQGVLAHTPAPEGWWALLATDQGPRVHRFDAHFADRGALPIAAKVTALQGWRDKLLIATTQSTTALDRFNATGIEEAPLVLTDLATARNELRDGFRLGSIAWGSAFTVLALLAFGGLLLATFQHLRASLYAWAPQRGAGVLDEFRQQIEWLEHNRHREAEGRRWAWIYAVSCVVAIGLLALAGVAPWALLAMVLMLTGPMVSLVVLNRSTQGHIGRLEDQVLLVDHNGQYHIGSGIRVHYRDNFVLIDDVVVFLGTRWLPTFRASPLFQELAAQIRTGVRVQRRAVAVRLLQSGHPLAFCALLCAGCAALALLVTVIGLIG